MNMKLPILFMSCTSFLMVNSCTPKNNSAVSQAFPVEGRRGNGTVFGFALPENCNEISEKGLENLLDTALAPVEASVSNCPNGGCFQGRTGELGGPVKTFELTGNDGGTAGITVRMTNNSTTTSRSGRSSNYDRSASTNQSTTASGGGSGRGYGGASTTVDTSRNSNNTGGRDWESETRQSSQVIVTFGLKGKFSWGSTRGGQPAELITARNDMKTIFRNSAAARAVESSLIRVCKHNQTYASGGSEGGPSSENTFTAEIGLAQSAPGGSATSYINMRRKVVNLFAARLGIACLSNFYDKDSSAYQAMFNKNFKDKIEEQFQGRLKLLQRLPSQSSSYKQALGKLKEALRINSTETKDGLLKIFGAFSIAEYHYNNSISNSSRPSSSLDAFGNAAAGVGGSSNSQPKMIEYLAAMIPCSENFAETKFLNHGHIDIGVSGTISSRQESNTHTGGEDNYRNEEQSESNSRSSYSTSEGLDIAGDNSGDNRDSESNNQNGSNTSNTDSTSETKVDLVGRLGVSLTVYFNSSVSGSLVMAKDNDLVDNFINLVFVDKNSSSSGR